MTPRTALSTAFLALASLPGFAAPAAYVSSEGNDARNRAGCTLAQPCRTFQAAHDVVDSAGQVVALDSADYGVLTVTKSVSIVGSPAALAGISVAAGNGVTIATPGIDVVLRNLHITTGAGGARGIDVSAARSLAIENSVMANFAAEGIRIAPVTPMAVRVSNSVSRGNGGSGLRALGNGRGVTVTVTDSIASGNGQHGLPPARRTAQSPG